MKAPTKYEVAKRTMNVPNSIQWTPTHYLVRNPSNTILYTVDPR